MSMFSEIAIEHTVEQLVKRIEEMLDKHKGDEQACAVLKELGRFALTLFDWSTPDWAERYQKLFAEK